MASTLEPGPVFPLRDNYFRTLDFSRSTRKSNMAVGPRINASNWGGLTNIWQNTPRSAQNSKDEDHCPTSSTINDSPASLQSLDNGSAPGIQHDGAVTNTTNTSRNLPASSTIDTTPSSARTQPPLLSPTRTRTQGILGATVEAPMSTLSNAGLLSGSAPDIEPTSANSTYLQRRQFENKFRSLNIEGVNEFVPSYRNDQSRRGVQNGRFGLSDRGHMNGRDGDQQEFGAGDRDTFTTFDPSYDRSSNGAASGFSHPITPDSNSSNMTIQCSGGDFGTNNPHNGSARSRMPSVYDGGSVPLQHITYDHTRMNESNDRSTDECSPFHQQHPYGRGQVKADVGLFHPNRMFGLPVPHMTGLSYSADVQHINGSNSTAYLANQTAIHDFRTNPYTPSFTPPTASESQRSNSGSAPSTRASSQAVEARQKQLDAAQPQYHGRGPSGHSLTQQLKPPVYEYHSNYQVGAPQYTEAYVANHMVGLVGPGQTENIDESEDPQKPLSPFLKDFKLHCKTKRYELKDVYGYIVEFSGDQHGSRFIQGKLETANSDEKEQVFAEIQGNILQLMTDIFGNYVIQKLFEHGTQAQKKVLANQMKGRMLYLTTQVYGCRVVQKALEHVLTDQQASMVKELEGSVISIVENQNGNHVIQKAIERVPSDYVQFIMDAHKGQIVRLAKHNYGCRVIQRMLEHGRADIKQSILAELRDSVPSLIADQFGNYVMQHIIRHGEPADKFHVVQLVQQQLLFFSKHKFASNVVEAAIECAEEQQRHEILRGLTIADSNGSSPVYHLIRDQFGNYVIQKVLHQLHGEALASLVREIKHHLVTLRRTAHGKQVSAMEKALTEASYALGPSFHGRCSSPPYGRANPSRPFFPHQTLHPRHAQYGTQVAMPHMQMNGARA